MRPPYKHKLASTGPWSVGLYLEYIIHIRSPRKEFCDLRQPTTEHESILERSSLCPRRGKRLTNEELRGYWAVKVCPFSPSRHQRHPSRQNCKRNVPKDWKFLRKREPESNFTWHTNPRACFLTHIYICMKMRLFYKKKITIILTMKKTWTRSEFGKILLQSHGFEARFDFKFSCFFPDEVCAMYNHICLNNSWTPRQPALLVITSPSSSKW